MALLNRHTRWPGRNRFAGIVRLVEALLVWMALFLATPMAGHCFDRDEHQTVADAAYFLAAAQFFHVVKYIDPHKRIVICGFLRKDYLSALPDCFEGDPASAMSYGEISACVDNVESAISLRTLADSGIAMPQQGTPRYDQLKRAMDDLKGVTSVR